MQINFQGQYDKELFNKGVRLANRMTKGRLGFMVFLLIIGAGTLGVMSNRIRTVSDLPSNGVYVIAALILIGVATFNLVQPYFIARKLWANPGVQRKLKGQVTAQGITYVFPEGRNEITWDRINRLQKTADLITLIRGDGLLLIFPRHFFKSKSDWQKFEKLVSSRVVSMDRARRRRR